MKPVIKSLAAAFAACAATPFAVGVAQAQTSRYDTPGTYEYRETAQLGVVQSVETVRGTNQGNRVAGTILGGVIGGVLGHQIGSGRGNDVATVAGALGGAAVGHGIGERSGSEDFYRVTVRLDDGDTRVVEQSSDGGLRSGDRVRVDADRVTRYAGAEPGSYPYQGAYQGATPPDAYVPAEKPADRDRGFDERNGIRTDERGYRYDRDGNRIEDRPAYRNDSRERPDPMYRIEGEVYYDAQGYRIDSAGRRMDDRNYRN